MHNEKPFIHRAGTQRINSFSSGTRSFLMVSQPPAVTFPMAKRSIAAALLALTWSLGAMAGAASGQQSNLAATSSIAIDVLMGRNDSLSYESALAALEQAAESGDVGAKRARVLIWLMDLPHQLHRRSFTNAFLLLREASELDSQAILSKLPDPSSKELRTLVDIDGFIFERKANPLTDEESCRLTSAREGGVLFGFDMMGSYVESDFPMALSDFESMGLRVDKHKYHTGKKPESVTEYERRMNAAKTLFVNGEISADEIRKLRPEEPTVTRIYLADRSAVDLSTLLREVAVGREVVIRVLDRSNRERISRIPLGAQEMDTVRFTLADLPTYAYARCIFP